MNLIRHNAKKLIAAIFLLVTCSSLLVACGGSSDGSDTTAGIGGTGIVFGKITGFGSVHVNGGTFEIDNSLFNVDGDTSANQGDLALGMVIALEVEVENGVYTGEAIKVVYDDEIEGPVSPPILDPMDPTIKTGIVFGQTITFDEGSTIFAGTSFDSIGLEDNLGPRDVIEVSGFRTSATEIVATYVRFDKDLDLGNTEVELRGPIKTLMGTPPNETFIIDGTSIIRNPGTVLEVPSGVLVEDMYVEVKGVIQLNLSVVADKIEEEDEDFDDDVDDISLQGIVLVYNGINDFFIGNQRVDASTAKFSPTSLMGINLLGMNIEVEGEIVGGTLIADEVEAREGETKLRSTISTVDTINELFRVTYPTLMPGEVVVRIDGQTLFEDETGPVITPPFSLDDLLSMDFVRIEGQEVNGEVVASVVKRVNGVGQNLKLEGAVDSFVTDSSITILGITYDVDPTPGGTDFDGFLNSAAFFAALNPTGGDIVEIEDDDVADGIADEVELE